MKTEPATRLDFIGVDVESDAESGSRYDLLLDPTDDDRPGSSRPASAAAFLRERITSPRRIRELIATIFRYRWGGHIVGLSSAEPVRAVAAFEDPTTLVWGVDGAVPAGPLEVVVAGYNSIFRIVLSDSRLREGRLETPQPTELIRLRHRGPRRAAAPPHVRVTLFEPTAQRALTGKLRDVSLFGFSVELDGPAAELRPGSTLPSIEIQMLGEAPVRLSAEVRSVQRGATLIGVRVDPRPARLNATWLGMVMRQLYPRTAIGSRWAAATWRLYQRAGYFRLSDKSDEDFASLREDFCRVSKCIEAAPHVGVQAVWPAEDGEVVAALSLSRIYSGTWFGYQMAKVRGEAPDGTPGRVVLRDLHIRAYEHVHRDPAARWVIGYAQTKQVWSRLVHYDLPLRYQQTGMAAIVRFRALELACGDGSSAHAAVEVGTATATERATFLSRVAADRPPAYVEALDLTPARFDLREHLVELRSSGLASERQLLAARVAGRMVAAAVLEARADGLHLFRLLDAVRLYRMDDAEAAPEAAFAALLDAARAWYRARGKARFVCLLEDEQALPPSSRAGMSDMGAADMTILAADLLPELLEHLSEVKEPRFGSAV